MHHCMSYMICPWVPQSISQSIDRSINQSIDQSVNQLIDQSINQLINQSINWSINQSINWSIHQSINQSADLGGSMGLVEPPFLPQIHPESLGNGVSDGRTPSFTHLQRSQIRTLVRLTLDPPQSRVINFKFLLQPHQKYYMTLWRTWLFIAYSDDYTTVPGFSLPHLYISL